MPVACELIPEFVALTLALSTYTAAFIAEIVRAGILAVHKGQMEAGSSLGLARSAVLRLIIIPAGLARYPAAADQPVSQPHQELVAGGGNRLSGSGLSLRRHDASQTGQAIEIIGITIGRLSPDLAGDECDHELLWLAARTGAFAHERNRDRRLRPEGYRSERPAPVKTTGLVGFLRTRLFNSPTNILITIVSALLLWLIVVPSLKFLFVDAVWSGKDRTACLAEATGHTVGACWPFIQAKFSQFIYGFYPEPERWRVNLDVFSRRDIVAAASHSKAPGQGNKCRNVFLAFPVVAFFLLHGGGINGFAVSWTANLLSGFASSVAEASRPVLHTGASVGEKNAVGGLLLQSVGWLMAGLGAGLYYLIAPLTSWLRDQLQASGHAVWTTLPSQPQSSRSCCFG